MIDCFVCLSFCSACVRSLDLYSLDSLYTPLSALHFSLFIFKLSSTLGGVVFAGGKDKIRELETT